MRGAGLGVAAVAVSLVLVCGMACATASGAAPPADQPSAVHPTFCPSEEQIKGWVDAGYKAFTTGQAYDDAFSVPGVSRWFWLPSEVTVIGDSGALVALSCETPELLATYTAWRGTRSAVPEAQVIEGVYTQLARQQGYCRFVVVGLARSSAGLGWEYVLRVNGKRHGQPAISSPFDQPLSNASSLLDRRDYQNLSVTVAERFDVEYVVDVPGQTYNRTQARSSVGYERRARVSQGGARTGYRHLVTEIVDFPLVGADGVPLIPADAQAVTLEMLASDASYEVTVNPVTGWEAPSRGHLVSATKTGLRQALEDIAKRPEYADWILKVSQMEPRIPTIAITVQPGRSPYETRKALKALVLEGQKACEDGNLVIVLDIAGRKLFEARYNPTSKSVVVRAVP